MIRCNGYCSAGREIHAQRTPAGVLTPTAEPRTHCFASSASIAVCLMTARWDALKNIAGWMARLCKKYARCPNGTLTWRSASLPLLPKTIPQSLLMRRSDERGLCPVAAPLCPASRSHFPRREQDPLRAQLEEGGPQGLNSTCSEVCRR